MNYQLVVLVFLLWQSHYSEQCARMRVSRIAWQQGGGVRKALACELLKVRSS